MQSLEKHVNLELDLGNPRMTLLHRAGIAGLWMTLKYFENHQEFAPDLSWKLTPRSVSLHWKGKDLDALESLLRASFRVDSDGLISFAALEPETMDFQNRLTIHQGIRGTFLQHNQFYKGANNVTRTLKVDENSPEMVINYQTITSFAHQTFAASLCDKHGKLLTAPISISGWLNPGSVVRHYAFSNQTGFEEQPEDVLALLFAPIACQYFILRSQLRDKRAQYAVVIPEVTNLEAYAHRRHQLKEIGYKDFHASSLGDAGLKFLTYKSVKKFATFNKVQRCQVLTLGTVAWSSQQKSRTDLYTIEADESICANYQASTTSLVDRIVQSQNSAFIAPSFARELIADNLARGLSWHSGFSEKVNSGELFKKLTYEREGLFNMIESAQWNEESEKLFVEACHEALRMTYGKMSTRAKDKGELPRFDRENERIRSSLGRCKNAETFRQFITDFWSRAGQIQTLQKHWLVILRLITGDKSWKIARDLTLLSLASYKSNRSEIDEELGDFETQD